MRKQQQLGVQTQQRSMRPALPLRWGGWRSGGRDTIAGYLFIAPFLFFYGIFLVYPSIEGFWISLHNQSLLGTGVSFVGLDNYRRLVADEVFWSSLRHTLYFVLLSTPTLLGLGLFLALLINRPYRGMGIFRAAFYLSSVLSVSVVTTVWLKVFDPNYGLIADVFKSLGLGQPLYVFQDPTWAMPAVALVTLWWTVGTNMILFLAGLQDISPEIYEAARLDGANKWILFRHITVPGLRRTFAFAMILQVIASMQVFGQVYNLTQGGPMNDTQTLVMYIYNTAFRDFNLGYGSALSYALFLIMFVFSLIQLHFFNRSEDRMAR
ncbi:MAG: sugar ABC transporter permease [Chloroflexi bacterium]|nr:sugar ABC transporter permease [Chloroflexota bacterium]